MTAGTGHRRSAEAVAEAIRQRLPQAELFCEDLLRYSPGWLRWSYPRIYSLLVRYLPSGWELAYEALDHPWAFRLLQPCRRRWNWLMARRFLAWVKVMQPDVVIATHFFPADVLGAARCAGWLRARSIVVITDLFPHRFWLVPGVDAFVVGSHETKAVCQRRAVKEERLHVLGIPISARFRLPVEPPGPFDFAQGSSRAQPRDGQARGFASDLSTRLGRHPERGAPGQGRGPSRGVDRTAVAGKLGLDPSRLTILIAGGGIGVGPIRELTQRARSLETMRPRQVQLLVVCGYNRKLMQRLERMRATSVMPLRLFGFVETMHELMQASDLLVTKAGGLTVMEALALGLPMVFCGMIPGQERPNADYVVQHGAGVMANNVQEVIDTVLRLLDDPDELASMRSRAMALGRPSAAGDLVERLILQQ